MKKILFLLMSLLLCVAIVSCVENDNNVLDDGNKETDNTEATVEVEEEAPGLSELRKSILDSGNTLGVAYLGYNEGTFSDVKEYFGEIALYEEYPFVKNMELDRYCVTGGDEHYLVVPAEKESSVKVYIGVPNFETYCIDRGELVFEASDGKPFIVRGNESEIYSNIIIEYGDVEYTLYHSGEDGKLIMNDKILDFSPYEAVNEYFSADAAFCGSWYCEAENGDYELMSMTLNLYADKTAEYSYGYGNSEPIEHFRGDWVYDRERDMILLGMYGGEIDSDFVYIDPYVLECGFKWNMVYRDDGTYLTLVHEEGDPLIFGKNGATFEFVNILEDDYDDYSYLQATWAIISEKKEVYLELFEGGEAHYGVKSDEEETNLWGYWSAEGLTLYLDLYGEDYGEAEGKAPLYSGEYGIMYDGEFLTLSLFDGFAMTECMAENGYDSFMCYGVG